MEELIAKSIKKINQTHTEFRRFLLNRINFSNRLIAIKGARGTGKTTLLLQYAQSLYNKKDDVLYIAMDDLFFYKNTLYELAKEFSQNNGKHLLLDEVHKYPNWSREIKLIYDDLPELHIVFTSSSILNIFKGESDLSRRCVSYILPELSLREFIQLESKIQISSYPLKSIIQNHQAIEKEINKKIKPIYEFNKYLKYGQYPYFIEGVGEYYQKLLATIHLILEIDLKAIEDLDYNNISKLKKLLYTIATSVPFFPNISKLSEKVELSRPFMIKALRLLEEAQMIKQLHKNNKGISYLSKPDKIFLNNTNLIYTIAHDNANIGNIRETFFLNQLHINHLVTLPKVGDFEVDNKYVFETGGKKKGLEQIKTLQNAYVVKDDIEYGSNKIIPLWLFGFMY